MIGIVLGVLIGLVLLVCIEALERKMQKQLVELYENIGVVEQELARLKSDMKSEGE